MNDDELMADVKSGDRYALAVLFGRHNDRLVRWLRKKCGKVEKAQDLAQEVWVKCWQSARVYYGIGKFEAWLLRMARNTLVDAVRKESRTIHTIQSIENEGIFNPDGLGEVGDGLEGRMLSEQASRIESLLPELPEKQQEAFCLYAFCGMSMSQIAEQVGAPIATVKSRLRLAREKLIGRSVELGYVADLEIAQKYTADYGLSLSSAG